MPTLNAADRLWHGTARTSRDEQRRRRLLDAALELYGTVGYRATTVRALCSLSHVSTRSFYELFDDQDALLRALYRELNGEILAGFARADFDASVPFETAARLLVESALSPMLLDERKARVLEVESVGVSEQLEQERRSAYRTFAEAIDDIFAAFAQAGAIAAAPPSLSSLILVGGITETLVQRVQTAPGDRTTLETFLDDVADVIIRLAGSPESRGRLGR